MNVKRYLLALVVTLAFTSVALAAAAPDGTWTGDIDTPAGAQTITLTLKTAGDKLDGSMTLGSFGDSKLEEAKVSGDTVSFSTAIRGRSMGWTGTIKGDDMDLSMDMGMKATLKRAK